jgi:quinol monooxygenase YgiN
MSVRNWPPLIVVRAQVEPEAMARFLRWYQRVHLPHVLAIPGIVRAFRADCHRRGVNWAAVYELRDEAAIQEAFQSTQAQAAREEWEPWLETHVHEVSVEVYAGLPPILTYHLWN